MAAASRSLATALWGARFASGLLQPSYTTYRDTTTLDLSAAPHQENYGLAVRFKALCSVTR
jgi:hypothetical protein